MALKAEENLQRWEIAVTKKPVGEFRRRSRSLAREDFDDPEGQLPNWLLNRIDRGFRLRFALQAAVVANAYDCVLIDTQGAIGPLQDAALMAADILVSPITPEVLSAREFKDGTVELLDRLEPGSALGATLGPVKAVIYRQDRTADARLIASGIREDFIRLKGRVSVLDTVVPHAKAYKEAATLRVPVHRHEPRRDGVMPSVSTVMHQLAWELIPSLQGVHAGDSAAEDRLPAAAGRSLLRCRTDRRCRRAPDRWRRGPRDLRRTHRR